MSSDEFELLPLLSFPIGPANAVKIGFFSQDRSCQTEQSEIIQLKELTLVLQRLTKDCHDLQRQLNLTRGNLASEFDRKLQNKALDLYSRMNEKVDELERTQSDRVDVVRRAFKTQLTDALIKVHVMYDKNFKSQTAHDVKRMNRTELKKDQRIKELEVMVQRSDSIITMLKLQISELVNQTVEPTIIFQKAETPEPIYLERPETSRKYRQEEMDERLEEISQLKLKIASLETEIQTIAGNSGNLFSEMSALSERLQYANNLNQQLENDRSKLERQLTDLSLANEAAKANFAVSNAEQLEKIKRDAQLKLEQEIRRLQEAEQKRFGALLLQKEGLEERLEKERITNQEKMSKLRDVEHLAKREEALRKQVQELKNELERTNRVWERKFSVLRESLHALKDESYLRQQLQRQAAVLHQASVMYAADVPVGVLPQTFQQSVQRRKQSHPQQHSSLSYTVSMPTTAATGALFFASDDENQIVSSDEEAVALANRLNPLPSPPTRRAAVASPL